MIGIVRWYNSLKGIGFIKGNDGVDVIVYKSSLSNRTSYINQGERVVYNIIKTYSGLQAEDVKKF